MEPFWSKTFEPRNIEPNSSIIDQTIGVAPTKDKCSLIYGLWLTGIGPIQKYKDLVTIPDWGQPVGMVEYCTPLVKLENREGECLIEIFI